MAGPSARSPGMKAPPRTADEYGNRQVSPARKSEPFRGGLSVFGTSMSKLPHPSAWPVHVARPWRPGQGAGVLRAQDPLVDGQQGCALVAGWR